MTRGRKPRCPVISCFRAVHLGPKAYLDLIVPPNYVGHSPVGRLLSAFLNTKKSTVILALPNSLSLLLISNIRIVTKTFQLSSFEVI